MKLQKIKYLEYEKTLPQRGNHILAQQTSDSLIVYQAFNPRIAEYALEHQKFGGPHYKYSRMSWIKPNFLWMMYRCGWAQKEDQQRVLAIELSKLHFEKILSAAVHSSYKSELYENIEDWKQDLKHSKIRLQWDPDHGPKGNKLVRKAIQLGLRGEMLTKFGKEWIISIEDITEFVTEEGKKIRSQPEDLEVIKESVFEIESAELRKKLLMD